MKPWCQETDILVRCLNLDQVAQEAGRVRNSCRWEEQSLLFSSVQCDGVRCWSRVGGGHDACWDSQCQVAEAAGFSPPGPCVVTLAVALVAENFPCVCP